VTLTGRFGRGGLASLFAAFAIAACGDSAPPSAQDKAQTQVCEARADIQAQIETLQALPLTTASIDKARKGVTAIETDVQRIVTAQEQLVPERRKQVQAAIRTFSQELRTIVSDGLAAGLNGDVVAAVKGAGEQLSASFGRALAPIDCG
jgi:hypothetical protein